MFSCFHCRLWASKCRLNRRVVVFLKTIDGPQKEKQLSGGVLIKRCLKICSKFTGEHPCRSTISIKLLCNFIEIALRHECYPVNLLHIFRTLFLKNTSGELLLPKPWTCLIFFLALLHDVPWSFHTEKLHNYFLKHWLLPKHCETNFLTECSPSTFIP